MHQTYLAIRLSVAAAICLLISPASAIDIDDVQTAIFTPTCAVSGCHNGSQFPNLSAGVALGNTVNVASGGPGAGLR